MAPGGTFANAEDIEGFLKGSLEDFLKAFLSDDFNRLNKNGHSDKDRYGRHQQESDNGPLYDTSRSHERICLDSF